MSRLKTDPAARRPRNSVTDRPNRLKLLLRRQRWLLRPRVIGVAALVAIGAGYGALHRTHPGGAVESMRARFGDMTAGFGLRVTDLVIKGRANTPEPLLRNAIGVHAGDPIIGFSVEQARERIEKLSWVEHATVERRLPGTVVVQVVERRPFAIWQNQGKFVLVDRAGQVVTNSNVADFRQLPLIVGAGAPEAAAPLIDALTERPDIASRVAAAVRVGERRWNLALKSGITVMLPEGHEVAALDRLASLDEKHKLLDRPLMLVDLRLADRLVVRAKAEAQPQPQTGKDTRAAPAHKAT